MHESNAETLNLAAGRAGSQAAKGTARDDRGRFDRSTPQFLRRETITATGEGQFLQRDRTQEDPFTHSDTINSGEWLFRTEMGWAVFLLIVPPCQQVVSCRRGRLLQAAGWTNDRQQTPDASTFTNQEQLAHRTMNDLLFPAAGLELASSVRSSQCCTTAATDVSVTVVSPAWDQREGVEEIRTACWSERRTRD